MGDHRQLLPRPRGARPGSRGTGERHRQRQRLPVENTEPHLQKAEPPQLEQQLLGRLDLGVALRDPGEVAWSEPSPVSVNAPVEHDGMWFFQAQWDPPDQPRFQGDVASAARTAKTMASQNKCASGRAMDAMALTVEVVFLFSGSSSPRSGSVKSDRFAFVRSRRSRNAGPTIPKTAKAAQQPSNISVELRQSSRAPNARDTPLAMP